MTEDSNQKVSQEDQARIEKMKEENERLKYRIKILEKTLEGSKN